ncbi:hypothetical protein [Epilithonimonas hungarica]|uniref:Uncharacterized protein n=1 Tax=Epilithonimonas hungarica TaxID=454006 RepID=A0A1G7TMD4_9FLAO|nr:hypothetical protein [Epilithonimonas hungarica]MDP9955125.1 hypothetical protein [Epilithonimonas hungarica]SDG36272.1 hypothetical protein SAMN05421825_3159 [Epilithonimonas hungarica]
MKYLIKKQIKDRGIFAEFDLEATYTEDIGLQVEYLGDSIWEDACMVGAMVFYEYFKKRNKKGLNVKILSVKWMPVDTNTLIILYGIVDSLSKELKFEINNFSFSAENECFIFPECRALLI